MEVTHLWDYDLLSLEKEIDRQLKKTREVSEELREDSNSYEMTPFNEMPNNEVELLESKLVKLTTEYNKEKKKLNFLYDEKNELRELIRNILDNLFKLVAQKCESIIPIVQKYILIPIKVKDSNEKENTHPYFPMGLFSFIYKLCNDKQFEEIPEIDFFQFFKSFPQL